MHNSMLIALVAIGLVAIVAVLVMVFKKNKPGSALDFKKQLYVGNISYGTKERELEQIFAQYGQIIKTRVVRNSRTGRSKGFGFVTFTSAQAANQALVEHGNDLNGRTMVVRIAKPPQHK